ncbi:uncharacterized protein VP01_1904g2, partial [Puccinia sorghi]
MSKQAEARQKKRNREMIKKGGQKADLRNSTPLLRCLLPKLLYTQSPTRSVSPPMRAKWHLRPRSCGIMQQPGIGPTSSKIWRPASLTTSQKRAEVALRNIHQTGTVLSYTHDSNQHAHTAGWPNTPLMSLYQNGLKENIQHAVVMSNVQFDFI